MEWGALLLALGVREAWGFMVQSPYDTIYSDMGAYVDRAREIAEGVDRVYPRFRAFYPYGTHYLLGAEFWAFGFDRHKDVVRAVQAAMTAAPAFHFVLLASRFFKSRVVLASLAFLFAVWQPIVWFSGFFISEVPFVFLLFYNAWLMVRFAEAREGGLRLGITSAILFTVRPQFILTFALLAVLYVVRNRRVLFRRGRLGAYARVLAPWALVLG